jgi:hypothetical protein
VDTLVPTIQPHPAAPLAVPQEESKLQAADSVPAAKPQGEQRTATKAESGASRGEREELETPETSLEDGTPRTRLTLRDAVRLCGMSEKTLRRKLEAGLLHGYRETLDYGGFMWMIEAHSLAELYPDSAQLRDYIALLEAQLNEKPPVKPEEPVSPEVPTEARRTAQDAPISQEATAPPAASVKSEPADKNFVMFLIDENRNLKEDLRDRDIQLRNLQERSLRLERECGEQRGTATTQARVLEWFQKQPQAALPSPSPAASPTPPASAGSTPAGSSKRPKPLLLGLLSGVSLTFLLLFIVQHLFHRG